MKYVDYEWQGGRKVAVNKEFDGTNIDNLQCIAFTSAKGSDNILESSPVSIELAIQEGWYTKAGSKWKTMPELMLAYRASAFFARVHIPNALMGMAVEGEVEDITGKKELEEIPDIFGSEVIDNDVN